MIPKDFITEWRAFAPWIFDSQVEQDIVISRVLVEIFNDEVLSNELAFRGGAALSKLFLGAHRYSENIDLVQINASPIGPILNRLRSILDPLLGKPSRNNKEGNVNVVYKFNSEENPNVPLKLKIEINTRENFSVFGIVEIPYKVESRWFSGSASIKTYKIEEMLATKLRALYQRRKGRDLYDLWLALSSIPNLAKKDIVMAFRKYLKNGGHLISKKDFLENMKDKMSNKDFLTDINPLITDIEDYNINDAYLLVKTELLELL
jgi:predicted nucleotidyltransferase component of viral defense system